MVPHLAFVFQWRRGLKLSGEAAVENITLDGVRGLRVMLSATVHDVLYYMSPIYCQSIIDSVLSSQLYIFIVSFIFNICSLHDYSKMLLLVCVSGIIRYSSK